MDQTTNYTQFFDAVHFVQLATVVKFNINQLTISDWKCVDISFKFETPYSFFNINHL